MADNSHSILVIDDDNLLLNSLSDALTEAGFTALTATNGPDGLALALDKKPDLILLDYQMPGMNGAEMLVKLREDEWGKKALVIFATNTYDVELLNRVMEHGVTEYILKADSSLDQIVALVNKHFTSA